MKQAFLFLLFCLYTFSSIKAVKFVGLRVIDKEYLMVHLRDGEVRYEDDGKGPGAYLGHTSAEDTLVVFGKRLQPDIATKTDKWSIYSKDDRNFTKVHPLAVWRKSKPMNTDHTLTSELDHWLFLQLYGDIARRNGSGRERSERDIRYLADTIGGGACEHHRLHAPGSSTSG